MRDPKLSNQVFTALQSVLTRRLGFPISEVSTPGKLVAFYDANRHTISKQQGVMEMTSATLMKLYSVRMTAK